MNMMGSAQPYSRGGMQGMTQGPSSNILRQRVGMGAAPGAAGQSGPGTQGTTLMGHMQRPMTGITQNQNQSQGQQSGQQPNQQMMHGNTQPMGYPQGPNF